MPLILARHAESTWNRQGRLTGCSDAPLTPRGEAQARAAGRRLAQEVSVLDAVHTSDLARAGRTAQLMLEAMGRPGIPVGVRPLLRERALGVLEGLTKEEVRGQWGNEQRKRWRDDPNSAPPGGETIRAAEQRFLICWHRDIVADLIDGRSVLVVAHAGTIRAILGHLGYPPSRLGNAAWVAVPTEAVRCGPSGAACPPPSAVATLAT
ncbi:MAG: histidine phosphatase family protein [Acidobacteriota bacterium]|nr:histidine phosphatase family protein [Acidobacteriota bacterium]